ncbi:hypothetical protein GCM10020358_40760 [Amorphoplanes nipponensis]|uniref:Uncharacterized protein n=1 Tax=Actinoplanes nipponensis TaxID=135950 RepID=A0A919JBL9_9ACTN|nr:hypothetical protein Ani05nite_09150 [Actinoplanes nipponensis]
MFVGALSASAATARHSALRHHGSRAGPDPCAVSIAASRPVARCADRTAATRTVPAEGRGGVDAWSTSRRPVLDRDSSAAAQAGRVRGDNREAAPCE